jgi:methionyl-tRNA synthetase
MQKNNTFYITTPIYYTNGIPHIWHSYSSIIADVIARYKKINGFQIKFSTWVDENSQKALLKAEEEGLEIKDYLNIMASKHKEVWDGLNIKYTDFIRTTEERHHKFVKQVLQKTYDNGDIYEWEYEWMYCVGCEAFKKDSDLTPDWLCPDHKKKPDKIKEKNYFFRLSKYQDKLLKFYEENPDFVVPNDRFNEVKAFVKRGLEDFSISRETNKFGIKLPFDDSQVTYVWYDALFNYLTVCQNDNESFWPANLHVVWKDIIRFHAVYWPAMLMSIWYDIPKQILTTWFFTVDGQKMSKSLWNVIDPVEYGAKFSREALTLYLLSSFHIWQDGDFDQKQAILTYNAKLANNLWNLVNRVVVLTLKLGLKGWLNSVFELFSNDEVVKNYFNFFTQEIQNYHLKESLDISFFYLDELNKYVDKKEPWQLIKTDEDETKKVLYTVAEWLRQVWLCLYPFFPEKMWEMFEKLGLENYKEQLENGRLEELRNKKEIFQIKEKWENLFERFEV